MVPIIQQLKRISHSFASNTYIMYNLEREYLVSFGFIENQRSTYELILRLMSFFSYLKVIKMFIPNTVSYVIIYCIAY